MNKIWSKFAREDTQDIIFTTKCDNTNREQKAEEKKSSKSAMIDWAVPKNEWEREAMKN